MGADGTMLLNWFSCARHSLRNWRAVHGDAAWGVERGRRVRSVGEGLKVRDVMVGVLF